MLHELIRYADTHGLASQVGLKPKRVRWLLVFEPSGRFVEVLNLAGDDKKSKGREFAQCPDLSQPEMVSTGSRHFLVDSVDIVVLLTKNAATDRDQARHESYVDFLKQAAGVLEPLAAIASTLGEDGALQAMREALLNQRAKPTDLATLAVLEGAEPTIFVARSDWHDWWQQYRASMAAAKQDRDAGRPTGNASGGKMRCFLSGALVDPAATQNKVSGLCDVGGLATGDVLSSFDKDAFAHFGLAQGQNAAMSEAMVKKFTDSLNHLIQHRSRRVSGTRLVYWFSKPLLPEDDPIAEVLGTQLSAASEARTGASWMESSGCDGHRFQPRAARLLEAIHSGRRNDLQDCQFYSLTLSGNCGRVIIRDWLQGSFEQLIGNINAWFDDLSIISRDGRRLVIQHKFAAVLASLVRDLSDLTSPAIGSIWKCALQNGSVPASWAAQALSRVRIDVLRGEAACHARLGLLRAYCVRHPGIPSMSAELDPYQTSPAYLCGRMMALLAAIQERALGTSSPGLVERHYAAASAAPALVLGRLIRTAQFAHLPELDGKWKHHYESGLSELWNRMKSAPPAVLSLEEQTLFAMGFYHQQAARFQAAKEEAARAG